MKTKLLPAREPAEFPERTRSGRSAISVPVTITTGSVEDGVHALNFGIHVGSS